MRILRSTLASLILLAGCAGDTDMLEIVTPSDGTDGKEDSLFDYAYEPAPTEFVELSAMEIEGISTATARETSEDGPQLVLVESPLFILDPTHRKNIQAHVTTNGVLEWLLDDLRFLVFAEDISQANAQWKQFTANGYVTSADETKKPVSVNYFEAIDYDADTDTLTVYNEKAPDGIAIEGPGLTKRTGRLAIFVVPSASSFNSIEGEYNFKLTVSCDGEPCSPAEISDPGTPEEDPENPKNPEEDPEEQPGEPGDLDDRFERPGDGPVKDYQP